MGERSAETPGHDRIPVINLASAPGERQAWGRPAWVVYLWGIAEAILVTNPLQISSRVRVAVLRVFGAKIGAQVIFRPRTRVKSPWKLQVGDRSWIGEGVWIHNQDQVTIGHDVVVSQESFITTGSHRHRSDMALITAPVDIREGTWITSRVTVTGGTVLGRSCLIAPNSLVREDVPANAIFGGNPGKVLGARFEEAM